MFFSFSFSAVFLDGLVTVFFSGVPLMSPLMRVSNVSLDTPVNVYIKVPYAFVRHVRGH